MVATVVQVFHTHPDDLVVLLDKAAVLATAIAFNIHKLGTEARTLKVVLISGVGYNVVLLQQGPLLGGTHLVGAQVKAYMSAFWQVDFKGDAAHGRHVALIAHENHLRVVGIVAHAIHIITGGGSIPVGKVEVGVIPCISLKYMAIDFVVVVNLVLHLGQPVNVVPLVGFRQVNIGNVIPRVGRMVVKTQDAGVLRALIAVDPRDAERAVRLQLVVSVEFQHLGVLIAL